MSPVFLILSLMGNAYLGMPGVYTTLEGAEAAVKKLQTAPNKICGRWSPCDPNSFGGVKAWCSAPASGSYAQTRSLEIVEMTLDAGEEVSAN